MAKYVFDKCTSCQIGGIVRRKSDGIIFDTEEPKWKGLKSEIEAAAEAGYLAKFDPKRDKEIQAKAEKEAAEKAKAEKEAAEKAKAEKEAAEKAKAEKEAAEKAKAEKEAAEKAKAEKEIDK